jgi:hypothetical protein
MGRPRGTNDAVLTERRLAVWRGGALAGVHVDDIAASLGMTRAALDRFVSRQRAAGHPWAVYHVRAQLPNANPTAQQLHQRLTKRIRDRARYQRTRGTLTRDTPDC